jgi:hypothetical protein
LFRRHVAHLAEQRAGLGTLFRIHVRPALHAVMGTLALFGGHGLPALGVLQHPRTLRPDCCSSARGSARQQVALGGAELLPRRVCGPAWRAGRRPARRTATPAAGCLKYRSFEYRSTSSSYSIASVAASLDASHR